MYLGPKTHGNGSSFRLFWNEVVTAIPGRKKLSKSLQKKSKTHINTHTEKEKKVRVCLKELALKDQRPNAAFMSSLP